MKKLMKIILVVIAVIIIGIVILVAVAKYRDDNYYKFTETSGEIEKKYTALGDKEVSFKEYTSNNENIGKYTVYYPEELKNNNSKYPVVIFANGTGSTADTYRTFFRHLSSWGFITIGNDDKDTRTGNSLEETIKFIIQENENPDSIFYQKIDTENIGLSGHSQGGVAVFNMMNHEHGHMIKAVYTASATSSYHTEVMGDDWKYDISKVNIPAFMIAGTGNWDAGTADSKEQANDEKNGIVQGICPLWSLNENYDLLPETKVMARRKNTDHGDSYKQADGYMTAWFMYYLQGDNYAGSAFFGDNPEILSNKNWQDIQVNE